VSVLGKNYYSIIDNAAFYDEYTSWHKTVNVVT